jgi:hypothetical protein
MPFGEVAVPAIELAEHGFPVNRFLHSNLGQIAARLDAWPSSQEVFRPGGRPPRVGQRLIQRDLARTLRALVEAECGSASRHDGLEAVRVANVRRLCQISGQGRAAGPDELPRVRCVRLRPVVPRSCGVGDAEHS